MPGFNWIIPLIDRMYLVNVTEVMVNAEPQEIITSDKLKCARGRAGLPEGQE